MNILVTTFGGILYTPAYATVALVNNTTKTQDIVVPAGEQWELWGANLINNDNVTRVCRIDLYDGTNLVINLAYGATVVQYAEIDWPSTSKLFGRLLIDPGWFIRYTWTAGGASAGAATNPYVLFATRKNVL